MLFDRQFQTRILCIAALIGWAAGLLGSILLGLVFLSGAEQLLNLYFDYFRIFLAGVAAAASPLLILWFWRKCDRCRRRLFAEGKPYLPVEVGLREPWTKLPWWLPKATERPRHHLAARLLGSYRSAAIWEMATTGRLHCQWCGHEDGASPDYVVVSSD